MKRLVADMNNDIVADLDSPIFTKQKKHTTLRNLILNIRSTVKETYNMPLFQGIDFTSDSKEIWINGMKGKGGPAHIYSFYTLFEAEAREMIRGIGVYLSAYHGSRCIYKCFSDNHWQGNLDWSWDRTTNTFKTPETRQIKANVAYDPNARMMDQFEKEDREEEARLRLLQDSKQLEKDAEELMKSKLKETQAAPKKRSKKKQKKKAPSPQPDKEGSELDTMAS